MASVMNLHAGGTVITREQLAELTPPNPTKTWRPHSHIGTVAVVEENLIGAGYQIKNERLAVHRDGNRMFGIMDLDSIVVPGLTLAIGIRNSYDQSFPFGMVGGTRTFVCSNLSFSGDLINVRRKHTQNGLERFKEATALAVSSLSDFKLTEQRRIELYQGTRLEERDASHLILQAYRKAIISHRTLPRIIDEYESPSFDFGPPSAYRLLQAFTTVLTGRVKTAPQVFAAQTIALNGLLSGFVGFDTPDLAPETVIDVTPSEDFID